MPTSCEIGAVQCELQAFGGHAGTLEKGSTNGLRAKFPARSPSTMAASSGRWRIRDKVGDTRVAAAAATGRHEHDRATRLALGEHARELEQCGRPDNSAAEPVRGGVAVGDDHDRAFPSGAWTLRDHRRQAASPAIVCAWTLRVET